MESASGPEGSTHTEAPGGEGHTGEKFTGKTLRGDYTITFSGDIAGGQLIVKDRSAHKHWFVGSGCPGTAATTSSSSTTSTTEPPTTTSSSSTTSTTEPPTTTTTESEVGGAVETTTPTTGDIGGEGAGETGDQGVAADPDSPDAEVGGETLENLPRTGRGLSQNLLLAGLALFLGGLAIRLGDDGEDPAGRPAA